MRSYGSNNWISTLRAMHMLWKNIKGLVGAYESPPLLLKGQEMNAFPVLEDAWLAIENGQVVDFGSMEDFPGIADWSGLEVIDMEGRFVLPAWCDSHTHAVFASSRSREFLSRLQGKTYQEIANEGGGILNSARALQSMSEEELFVQTKNRLSELMRMGTGAIEIKSGYGLTSEAELKMLRVIARLKSTFNIPICSTFLACHAVPDGWTAADWTEHAATELMEQVAAGALADFVDVFCEEGYFGLDELKQLLEAAAGHGIPAKVHVNQFNAIGGVAVAAELGARSVDHLEELTEQDVAALAATLDKTEGPTIACALPGCSYFLGIPYTPARTLMDANVPLAIASDFNPGSAPSGNMSRVVQLAMVKMKMLPIEAIAAATINGAAAMNCSDRAGVIAPGRSANLLVTRPLEGLESFGYDFGQEPVEKVFMDGSWV